jgi:hypothetical protein
MPQADTPRKDISNPAKLLRALIHATGITDCKQLSEMLAIPVRTLQRLKLEVAYADPVEPKVDTPTATCATSAKRAISGAATSANDAISGASGASRTHARIETPYGVTLTEDKNPPTPLSGGSPQPDANELARKAYEAGIKTKGGATAKSGRAVQRTKGELDGSQGVLFDDGKLTLLNGTAAMIAEEFPGIDLVAVANKAAPDIAKMSYPSRSDALAQIRKHAQWAIERKAPAGKHVSPAESRLERNKSFYAKLAPKTEAVQ